MGERLLFAGLADGGSLHGEGADDFALADLAGLGLGGSSDASRNNFDEFLLFSNSTGSPRIDGEERSFQIHESW